MMINKTEHAEKFNFIAEFKKFSIDPYIPDSDLDWLRRAFKVLGSPMKNRGNFPMSRNKSI